MNKETKYDIYSLPSVLMLQHEMNTEMVKDLNETVRPALERLVSMRYELDALVAELSNQQTPIAATSDVLNDGAGDAPRDDAPTLTGQNIAQLLTFATNMRDQIDSTALDTITSLMVRDVNSVIRG